MPIQVGGATRTMGVYLPPGYDPDRAEPYKTIYMQHGGGQDQSDWMNIGSVPVIMDNLIQDGDTEPAVVVTTATNYLGSPAAGYPNLREVVLPYVESHYNVSTRRVDRAFAGLSAGSFVTMNLINDDPTLFGFYGPWSGGMRVSNATPDLSAAYIPFGGGAWDFGLPNAAQVEALSNAFVENVVVSGAHDFNALNQLFTTFARDYLWKPEAFIADEIGDLRSGVASTSLNKGNRRALTVKVDRTYELVVADEQGEALEELGGFVNQVNAFQRNGKLTAEQATALLATAEKLRANLRSWQ